MYGIQCITVVFCLGSALQQNRKAPAKNTLVKKIGLIAELKPLGLEAWRKVTFQAVGRNSGFSHHRVTMKMVTRELFLKMGDEEQEIYILRLAL